MFLKPFLILKGGKLKWPVSLNDDLKLLEKYIQTQKPQQHSLLLESVSYQGDDFFLKLLQGKEK